MYVTGQKVLKKLTGVECTQEDLGGAATHSKSGVVHFISKNEEECFKSVRNLISILPSNCSEKIKITSRYKTKKTSLMEKIPSNYRKVYDMHIVIDEIIDSVGFIEVHRTFAPNIIIGFAKIAGITVGIVANNPGKLVGRFCDCFNIPIVTFVDVPGFIPNKLEEEKGIIRHGAKLLFAYAESTTIKVTVILRKAYGGAYIAMGSKHLGADMVFCWPNAEVAVMGSEGAIEILYHRELEKMNKRQREENIKNYCQEYEKKYISADAALKEGYIDAIIEPDETRKKIFDTLVAFINKEQRQCISKKHENMPL